MGFKRVGVSDLKQLRKDIQCLSKVLKESLSSESTEMTIGIIQAQEVGNPENTFAVYSIYDTETGDIINKLADGTIVTEGVDFELLTISITDKTIFDEYIDVPIGETTFTLSETAAEIIAVFRNGVEQQSTEYVFTPPNIVTLNDPVGSIGGAVETIKIVYNKA